MNDAELAARLAMVAGRILLSVQASGTMEPGALGRAADQTTNQFLVHALRNARPDDGLLSEEMRCDGSRLGHSRVWIVDPLDGTREYGEARADWAVHVGLAIDGIATVGAVALPGRSDDMVLRSDRIRRLPPVPEVPRIAVSRTRPPTEAIAVAKRMGAILVPMGSAGAKAMAVILGEADIYIHAGGQYEWDSCAPVAVAQAHGLHCSRLDGKPLRYNCEETYLPDLIICRPELTEVALYTLNSGLA